MSRTGPVQREDPPPLALVALGGNALLPPDEPASIDAQRAIARRAARSVASLAGRYRLVVTHGNGPQVGAQLARSDAAASRDGAYPVPVDVAVAQTQGEIGYLLQEAFSTVQEAPVVPVVTRVEIDTAVPGGETPVKPVGPALGEDAAHRLEARGIPVGERDGRLRRVVPSPEPRRVLEVEAIRGLVQTGAIVVAAGGGGVPVEGTDRGYEGVAAVVDKDKTSALLAQALEADALFLLTDVDRVHLDHGTPSQRPLDTLTLDQARKGLASGQFPPGSMGPKVQAAVRALEHRPSMRVVIGALDNVPRGTTVTPL